MEGERWLPICVTACNSKTQETGFPFAPGLMKEILSCSLQGCNTIHQVAHPHLLTGSVAQLNQMTAFLAHPLSSHSIKAFAFQKPFTKNTYSLLPSTFATEDINQRQLFHSDLMLQGSGSPARTANRMAPRTSHPADCQALSSHPAGSSAPPVSASHLLLLPNAENCSAAISLEHQLFPWRGFFFRSKSFFFRSKSVTVERAGNGPQPIPMCRQDKKMSQDHPKEKRIKLDTLLFSVCLTNVFLGGDGDLLDWQPEV